MRVGIGYDIHRFGANRPLRIGGIEFPGERGLVGHSDADPVMHAIADAILGAAGLGDIGEYFPDTDAQWKDADSAAILAETIRLAAERRNLVCLNVDVNIILERPKLGGRKEAMRGRLAAILALPVEQVSIKARTAEGLGPVGSGEAVEVHAAVLMDRRSTPKA